MKDGKTLRNQLVTYNYMEVRRQRHENDEFAGLDDSARLMLHNARIKTVEELMCMSAKDLLSFDHIGPSTVYKINSWLILKGLRLVDG